MIPIATLQKHVRSLGDEFQNASPLEQTQLSGDSSGRQYCRLELKDAPVSSLIVMIPNTSSGPLVSGEQAQLQADTFLSIGHTLEKNHIPAVRILLDARAEGFILLEDVGDIALWQLPFDSLPDNTELLDGHLGPDPTRTLFERAIDLIPLLQSLPVEDESPIFTRTMTQEQYSLEALRFLEHHFRRNPVSDSLFSKLKPLAQSYIADLAARCESHKRVTTHRDFMPWNLHVLPDGSIRILDYQDMFQASELYDLVSLLHDRDVDSRLGDSRILSLMNYAQSKLELSFEQFQRQYCEMIIQRSLRLAGQFYTMAERTKNDMYAQWAPGCMRRLGRFLPHDPAASELTDLLLEIALFREGHDDLFPLDKQLSGTSPE